MIIKRTLTAVVAIVGFGIVLTAAFSPSALAYHDTDWLDNHLPNYVDTIDGIEQTAVDDLGNGFCGDQTPKAANHSRDCLNHGLAYWTRSWITPRGAGYGPSWGNLSGNATMNVSSSLTSVPLELNSFFMYRAGTAAKTTGSTVGLGTLNYGMTAPNVANASRLSGGNAVDRKPADSPPENAGPISYSRSRIASAKIVAGGGSIPSLKGQIIGTDMTSRDTRYYYDNLNFDYDPASWGWWKSGNKTLTIEFTLQTVQGYNDGSYQCLGDGSGRNPGKNGYTSCPTYVVDQDIKFNLQPTWEVSVKTTSNVTKAYPGQQIRWTHSVTNEGSGALDQRVTYYSNGAFGTHAGGDHYLANKSSDGSSDSFDYVYTPTDDDLGKTFCQSTIATPQNWRTGSGPIESGQSCVKVDYNYSLVPHTTINGSGTVLQVQPGQTGITINSSVYNNGPTRSPGTQWALVRCVYGPTQTDYNTTAANSNSLYPRNGCDPYIAGGYQTSFDKNTTTPLPDRTGESVPTNAAIGTHICYVLAVQPASSSDNLWVHSAPSCLSVTKTPKVQALGGDLRAGTVNTTAFTALDGKYYGSWSEYGLFGIGAIAGMYSDASFAGGASSVPGASAQNALTFSNTTTPLGGFGSDPSTDYFTTYKALAGSDTTIPYGTVPNGTTKIMYFNSGLEITSDIKYTGSYPTLSDIPRVIIVVNGDVKIDNAVQQIDAWIITNGTLYTCKEDSDATSSLTINKCANQLTFNGPVIADKTRLSRTFGADNSVADRAKAAEVFNLDPATYLSSYSASVTSSNIQTVYEKELSPRW